MLSPVESGSNGLSGILSAETAEARLGAVLDHIQNSHLKLARIGMEHRNILQWMRLRLSGGICDLRIEIGPDDPLRMIICSRGGGGSALHFKIAWKEARVLEPLGHLLLRPLPCEQPMQSIVPAFLSGLAR